MTRIAFLGTGLLGGALAEATAKRGEQVTVWNRTLEKARGLEQFGVRSEDTTLFRSHGSHFSERDCWAARSRRRRRSAASRSPYGIARWKRRVGSSSSVLDRKTRRSSDLTDRISRNGTAGRRARGGDGEARRAGHRMESHVGKGACARAVRC